MPIDIEHTYQDDVATTPEVETSTEVETPTEVETLTDNLGDMMNEKEGEIYNSSIDEDDRIINTKEDVKYLMDKSKNSQELYENAIKVLTNMESNFKSTLFDVAEEENWDARKKDLIWDSSFNSKLNTENPKTLFEQKGKELLERAKNIQENLQVQNSASQVIGSGEGEQINENEKNKMIDELYKLRMDAIQNFKDDIEDGFLSNENNISAERIRDQGRWLGNDLFHLRETDNKKFEENINKMNLAQLTYATFNIEQGSGAFTYAYGKLKEKLGNKNLFDFIDEQNNPGDQTGETLKYSAFKMLFQRRMSSDLIQMMDGYSGNKEDLIKYVEKNIKEDESFKISFLTSIKDLENSQYFGNIAKELKENDTDVKRAYEAASNIDNIDIFKEGKVNGLMLYDDEGHGGGAAYFDADFKDYTQRKGFKASSKEENKDYKKYTLKKGNDTLTLVKLKVNDNDSELENTLKSLTNGEDYNLFALRGHCYNTGKFAETLGKIGAVGEGDLLIDGGCNNASRTRDYYNSGVKGQICAYTATGKGASTQAFIDRIISAKNSGKNFSDVLGYYNGLTSDSGRDGYFAYSTERPDSMGAQYKKLRQRHNQDDEGLEEDSNTTVRDEAEAQADVPPSVDAEPQVQAEPEV